jgi:hypothetical protein
MPLRVMIDTNIADELASDPDVLAMISKLQARGKIQLLITHLQEEQLAKASPHIKKTMKKLDPTIVNTSGVVWDVSNWDLGEWPDQMTEHRLTRMQGDKSKGKQAPKHWADTLIAVTAMGKADVYVTRDRTGRNAARRVVDEGGWKLQIWDYADFVGHVETLYATLQDKS